MTQDGLLALQQDRARTLRELLQIALTGYLPAGYSLQTTQTDDDHALLYLVPPTSLNEHRRIRIDYHLSYRAFQVETGKRFVPSQESLCAQFQSWSQGQWLDIEAVEDRIDIRIFNSEVGAAVREVVAKVLAHPSLLKMEWRPCPHDPKGKFELFLNNQKVQSIWRSGPLWGTLLGTCPKTKTFARRQAEAAACQQVNVFHQERLAAL